jgi:hypothetical protein
VRARGRGGEGRWVLLVLLSYRLPRELSTPRIGVWRELERLGVARLGDGLVALPADARTREQIEWLAEEIVEADGSATVWLAAAGSAAQERAIADTMRAARTAEYQAVIEQARAVAGVRPWSGAARRGGCAGSCAGSRGGTSSPRPSGTAHAAPWTPLPAPPC